MKALWVAAFLGLVVGGSHAEAKQSYYGALLQAFPQSTIDHTIKCQVCHSGRRMNAFGKDFVKLVKNAPEGMDFSVLAELDSDGDGISNVEELEAGTNPGVAEE